MGPSYPIFRLPSYPQDAGTLPTTAVSRAYTVSLRLGRGGAPRVADVPHREDVLWPSARSGQPRCADGAGP
jgi:hypothetical protein